MEGTATPIPVVHARHRTRYLGTFENVTVVETRDGFLHLRTADGAEVWAAADEMHDTEAEARAACKAARAPRRDRTPIVDTRSGGWAAAALLSKGGR